MTDETRVAPPPSAVSCCHIICADYRRGLFSGEVAPRLGVHSQTSVRARLSVVPSRLVQKKILSAEGRCQRSEAQTYRTHPFAKAEETKASFRERVGHPLFG